MTETRIAVAEAIRDCPAWAEDITTLGEQHWANEADAAIAAYEANPPTWLLEAVREAHRHCHYVHLSTCNVFPEPVRRAAGVIG